MRKLPRFIQPAGHVKGVGLGDVTFTFAVVTEKRFYTIIAKTCEVLTASFISTDTLIKTTFTMTLKYDKIYRQENSV